MPKRASSLYANLLRAAGYKATPARVGLLLVLDQAEAPLSIERIITRLKGGKTDQATVYRALNALAKAGLVREVDLRHGHAHYELNREDDHHHLVCTSCGKVEDVEGMHADTLEKKALDRSKSFAVVSSHALEFFGMCKTCAK